MTGPCWSGVLQGVLGARAVESAPSLVSGEESVSRKEVVRDDEKESAIDSSLVARAAEGDVPAFRQLVERYERRIYSVALGVMGNADDAEDVVQESFLKAFRNLASFRRESSFYTWIYRIAYNLAIDEKRRRYRHVEQSVGDAKSLDVSTGQSTNLSAPPSVSSTPQGSLERQELRGALTAALGSLSPDHRAVILLREIDGLSYSEISDVVGVSKGTVMSRLHHARRKLQEFLKQAAPESTMLFGDESNGDFDEPSEPARESSSSRRSVP